MHACVHACVRVTVKQVCLSVILFGGGAEGGGGRGEWAGCAGHRGGMRLLDFFFWVGGCAGNSGGVRSLESIFTMGLSALQTRVRGLSRHQALRYLRLRYKYKNKK